MRYRRVVIPGATYFFTINLLNRTSSLLIDHIDKLRHSFQNVLKLYPFEIDGIVILPDHIHMIMALPPQDSHYSLRIRLIKATFSKKIENHDMISPARYKKGERGIWQRRFWEHLIRDQNDYEHHLNYIHYNPVKHGYVKIASAWPYSSIHRAIRKGDILENWAYDDDLDNRSFGELVNVGSK